MGKMATHTHIILIPPRQTLLSPPQQSHLQSSLRRIFVKLLPKHFPDSLPRKVLFAQLLDINILLFGLGVFPATTWGPWTLVCLDLSLATPLLFLLETMHSLWIWEYVYRHIPA